MLGDSLPVGPKNSIAPLRSPPGGNARWDVSALYFRKWHSLAVLALHQVRQLSGVELP